MLPRLKEATSVLISCISFSCSFCLKHLSKGERDPTFLPNRIPYLFLTEPLNLQHLPLIRQYLSLILSHSLLESLQRKKGDRGRGFKKDTKRNFSRSALNIKISSQSLSSCNGCRKGPKLSPPLTSLKSPILPSNLMKCQSHLPVMSSAANFILLGI